MNTLILYCHPWEGSYNFAILKAITKGLEKRKVSYEILDLVLDGFNPVMTEADLAEYRKGAFVDPKVGEYQEKLMRAEEIIIITPIWWGMPPAILKGFFDKVFLPHWAYETAASGLLQGKLTHIKKATVISTMNSPQFYYNLFLKSPLKNSMILGTLKSCGVQNIKWISFPNVLKQKQEIREKWLNKLERYAES
ncbi:MAG TPA: NAD(P)H-dependent oxidoreductase [Treponemataceae bacterium]|nr:NAD(P)H-dependent oxidoreductase [Treponemataceae bacterium]